MLNILAAIRIKSADARMCFGPLAAGVGVAHQSMVPGAAVPKHTRPSDCKVPVLRRGTSVMAAAIFLGGHGVGRRWRAGGRRASASTRHTWAPPTTALINRQMERERASKWKPERQKPPKNASVCNSPTLTPSPPKTTTTKTSNRANEISHRL